MARAITLYGIANCDTVKRARGWLEGRAIDYRFHDFKREGLAAGLADTWLAAAGAGRVINRKGATWRKLTDAERAAADTITGARALMMTQSSVVKRPVLDIDGGITVGFDAAAWEQLLP